MLARAALLTVFALGLEACSDDPGIDPADARAPFDATADGLCPPRAPFGIAEGDRLPDPAMVDCAGDAFSLHALCEKKAAWQFHFAGW